MMATPISQGVQKQLLRPGAGRPIERGSTVMVHCTGSSGGMKFWSTKDPGQAPFTFQAGVGQVIQGWDEGMLTMREGEASLLIIAGFKGYGERGFPAWGIQPHATLCFEIEVMRVM